MSGITRVRKAVLSISFIALASMTTGLLCNLKKPVEEPDQEPTTSLPQKNKPSRPVPPPRTLSDMNVIPREKPEPDLADLVRKMIEVSYQGSDSVNDADSEETEMEKLQAGAFSSPGSMEKYEARFLQLVFLARDASNVVDFDTKSKNSRYKHHQDFLKRFSQAQGEPPFQFD